MIFHNKHRLFLSIPSVLIALTTCTNVEYNRNSENTVNSTHKDNLGDTQRISLPAELNHQPIPNKAKEIYILPKGYKLFDEIIGDLNGDGINDYILVVKGTDENAIIENRFNQLVDLSRRGLIIYLSEKSDFYRALENLACFSSENEDGGVYFAPELHITTRNGKLYIEYNHGRYGNWQYTFRFQNSDFEMIGYDNSTNYGPIVNHTTSINFLTKMKQTKENVNKDAMDSGEEVFEERWENYTLDSLYKLSEISNFDGFDYSFYFND